MEKEIMIGEKKVTLSNNVTWLMRYRNQFGKDILPTVMPVLATAVDLMETIGASLGDKDELEFNEFVKNVDGSAITDAMIHLSGLEFTDFMNIVWAMAKTADDSIPAPEVWYKDFDNFPMDELGPAVFDLTVKGLMSSKNAKRLQKAMDKMAKPLKSTQTQLSSQE